MPQFAVRSSFVRSFVQTQTDDDDDADDDDNDDDDDDDDNDDDDDDDDDDDAAVSHPIHRLTYKQQRDCGS